jgi:hypothetical protein
MTAPEPSPGTHGAASAGSNPAGRELRAQRQRRAVDQEVRRRRRALREAEAVGEGAGGTANARSHGAVRDVDAAASNSVGWTEASGLPHSGDDHRCGPRAPGAARRWPRRPATQIGTRRSWMCRAEGPGSSGMPLVPARRRAGSRRHVAARSATMRRDFGRPRRASTRGAASTLDAGQ